MPGRFHPGVAVVNMYRPSLKSGVVRHGCVPEVGIEYDGRSRFAIELLVSCTPLLSVSLCQAACGFLMMTDSSETVYFHPSEH